VNERIWLDSVGTSNHGKTRDGFNGEQRADSAAVSAARPMQYTLPGVALPRAPTGDREIDALLDVADRENRMGHQAEAEGHYRQALSLAESRQQVVAKVHVFSALGQLLETDQPLQAARMFQEAIALLQGAEHNAPPPLGMLLKGSRTIALIAGRQDSAAEPLAREVLAWATRERGSTDVVTLKALESLTQALLNQQKYQEAEGTAGRLLAASKRGLGAGHWMVARSAGYH
jgi:hypothetical protein